MEPWKPLPVEAGQLPLDLDQYVIWAAQAEAVSATKAFAPLMRQLIAEIMRQRNVVNDATELATRCLGRAKRAEDLAAGWRWQANRGQEALAQLIADTFGPERQPGEPIPESSNFSDWHTDMWLGQEARYRALLVTAFCDHPQDFRTYRSPDCEDDDFECERCGYGMREATNSTSEKDTTPHA